MLRRRTDYVEELKEWLSFQRSTILNLTSLALTRDEQHLLVGDGNGSNVHVCQISGRLKLRAISNIPSPTGIAVTNDGTVAYTLTKNTHCSAW